MKSFIRRMTALAAATTTAIAGTLVASAPVQASPFGQQEVNQDRFVAVAAPVMNGASHQLLIVEQVANSRSCWAEQGNTPTIVDPLLVNFDFTGICGRSTDSNGYSIRVNGEDLGINYSLRVVRENDDMVLVGAPFLPGGDFIEIGRTNGLTTDFARIDLNQGWKFTKRTYEGRTLGHVYLTYEGDLAANPSPTPTPTPTPTPGGNDTPIPTAPSFRDISNDIYVSEIEDAVEIGFIAGFPEDGTFRPNQSLTREQLVSIVLGALEELPEVDLNVPNQTSGLSFFDVTSDRWSASKIQFAQANGIVSGYEDGSFRPAQAVTRAELMAVLRRSAEYALTLQGETATLAETQDKFDFSDIANHWANPLIDQMSSYCGVASPLNEQGTAFAPDTSAQRNYATAATLRMMNCVDDEG